LPSFTSAAIFVAARCDMGGAPLWALVSHREYPLPFLTQRPLRHLLPLAMTRKKFGAIINGLEPCLEAWRMS
jgi:hypothetical protein